MTGYSIDGDPYLSEKTKAMLAQDKADGVDISAVEKFLRDTAPLVAPIEARPVSPVPLIIALAVGFVGIVWLLS